MAAEGPVSDAVDRAAGGVAPHALSAEEVLLQHGVQAGAGLDELRAARRLDAHGPNELAEEPPPATWRRFLRQFNDALVWILIAAAITSGVLREWVDAIAIVSIVILNAAIGFFQEERASRAIAALRSLAAPMARVIREGRWRSIPSRDVVPGDVIELEAGDRVPADARLVRGSALRVQEAALTGESEPADKDADAELPRDATVGERTNMVHMGTVVAGGRASAVVTATGMRTEVGRIAGLLRRADDGPTPLQRRLAEVGRLLIVICLAIVAVVFALELYRGGGLLEVFLLSVSLAVAAVPEGLPAVVTIALAIGLQRMVRRNALVRRLPSVETLGCVTVICSDKTGTLTRNEMTVRTVVTASGRFRVSGGGYVPRGEFFADGGKVEGAGGPVRPSTVPDLVTALEVGARCNRARLTPKSDGTGWEVVGDPTEGALVVAAAKAGFDVDQGAGEFVHEIPFDSERKAMSVVVRAPDGGLLMYTKGAPEVVLASSSREQRAGAFVTLTDERRHEILRDAGALAADALRVLGLACRRLPEGVTAQFSETDLVFVGLVGMIDPPREEARTAVQRCREAGIRPVMITGDHPATALAIARELGIAERSGGGDGANVITGRELEPLSDAELGARLDRTAVFARVSPEHKLRVVRAWQARGEVVAMTGDGVNDAPAVKAADIGIAMGATGTDVTREASDMVLLDDNFASIVNAVEEGRAIYDNIQKVLVYLLACNLGEILLLLGAGLVGWPLPLTPPQVLWINLVTDGIPALALAVVGPESDVMRRRPRPPRESILTRAMLVTIVFRGLLCAGAGLGAFAIALHSAPGGGPVARSMVFTTIVLAELLLALAARSRGPAFARSGAVGGPVLLAVAGSLALQLVVSVVPVTRSAFAVTSHSLWQWGVIVALGALPLAIVEAGKALRARRDLPAR